MADQPTHRSGVVPVSHHQFFLLDEDVYPEDGGRLVWPNGLATAAPGLLAIYTGIHLGPVDLRLELHDTPPEPELGRWEDVVELAVEAPTGALCAGALMEDVPDTLLDPITHEPGTYRARVHAHGRDTAVDLATHEPVEHYLIQLWPDTNTAEHTHKITSTYGRNNAAT